MQTELLALERSAQQGGKRDDSELIRKFGHWIEAMGAMHRLRMLRNMQSRLKSGYRSNPSE